MRKITGSQLIFVLLIITSVLILILFYFEFQLHKKVVKEEKIAQQQEQQIYSKIWKDIETIIDDSILNLPDGVRFVRKKVIFNNNQPTGDYLFLLKNEDTYKELKDFLKNQIEKSQYEVKFKIEENKYIVRYKDKILFSLSSILNYVSSINVIIDDCGYGTSLEKKFLELDNRIAFAVLPYLRASKRFAEEAKDKGFDVMLHLPMESQAGNNPGPYAVLTNLSENEILLRLEKAFNNIGIENICGVNNHMGSKATSDERTMRIVLSCLKNKGLFFIDSLTSNKSVGLQIAKKLGIPTAARDVFLDNTITEEYVRKQWNHLLNLSKKNGNAIAIGHCISLPTYTILKEELPLLKEKNIYLLRVTEKVGGYEFYGN
ncbi:MAG: divergent polysaccharide deacetylase family protein [Candidatus Hydrogenedentota bacterium]